MASFARQKRPFYIAISAILERKMADIAKPLEWSYKSIFFNHKSTFIVLLKQKTKIFAYFCIRRSK